MIHWTGGIRSLWLLTQTFNTSWITLGVRVTKWALPSLPKECTGLNLSMCHPWITTSAPVKTVGIRQNCNLNHVWDWCYHCSDKWAFPWWPNQSGKCTTSVNCSMVKAWLQCVLGIQVLLLKAPGRHGEHDPVYRLLSHQWPWWACTWRRMQRFATRILCYGVKFLSNIQLHICQLSLMADS